MNTPAIDVLVLRGLAREQRHWGHFPALFRQEVPFARLYTLDLPGVGTESGRASPRTVRGIMLDVRERLHRARGEQGPAPLFAIVGLSLSGMVVLDWADLFPDELSLVVSVNTSARNVGTPFERFAPQLLWQQLRARKRSPEERERIGLAWTSTRGATDPETVALYGGLARSSPVPSSVLLSQMLAGAGFSAPASVRVPLWFIVGEQDRLVSPSISRRLATRMNAGFLSHPTAGHDFTVDEPLWLAQQLRVLLRSV